MRRSRGFWWAPDGRSLLAARVDNGPVGTWWTSDPSKPESSPQPHRYPAAGTADASVSLWHLEAASRGGRRRQVCWDDERLPYLVAVHWSRWGKPLLLVEQRDHKAAAVLAVDLVEAGNDETITTSTILETSDAAWVDWPVGVPAWMDNGDLCGLPPPRKVMEMQNLVAAPAGCRPAVSSSPRQVCKSGRSRALDGPSFSRRRRTLSWSRLGAGRGRVGSGS